MDAKELRIGNWVYNDHLKPERVCSINPNGICVSVGNLPGFALCVRPEPIPLSPEILEKCGFEFKPIGEEAFEQVWTSSSGVYVWQHDEGFCYDYHMGGDINYLHQLQNLYWCLCGEELEVNFIHTDVENSLP